MDATVVLKCEMWDRPAHVSLRLSAQDSDKVTGTIGFSVGGCSASLDCRLLGYDIKQFITELRTLHKSLAGTARLSSFDELVDLRLGVVDVGKGSIRVDARMRLPTDCNSIACPLASGAFGSAIEIVFAGLRTDQSYLPQMIRELEVFVEESGLSTVSPWDTLGR